jgi:hypothetical protein
MSRVSSEQRVQTYPDEEVTCLQEVSFNSDDLPEAGGFMSVIHNDYEMLISYENWQKLNSLVTLTKIKADARSNHSV